MKYQPAKALPAPYKENMRKYIHSKLLLQRNQTNSCFLWLGLVDVDIVAQSPSTEITLVQHKKCFACCRIEPMSYSKVLRGAVGGHLLRRRVVDSDIGAR